MGYTVMPDHRRRGYAVEAASGMMDWARRIHGVRRFRLSISPSNDPSLAMAAKMGFVRTGEQMDEEDGLEYVFELDVP
jgi:ribosomal-protein-alanine N-acetyltransferase